jgi:hypothetical protein
LLKKQVANTYGPKGVGTISSAWELTGDNAKIPTIRSESKLLKLGFETLNIALVHLLCVSPFRRQKARGKRQEARGKSRELGKNC